MNEVLPFLEKCAGQKAGNVVVSILFSGSTGKIIHAKILSSDFTDKTVLDCIISTLVEKTRVSKFNAESFLVTHSFLLNLKKHAEDAFEKGISFVKQKKYEMALIEFQSAYEIMPEPLVLFNIASCLKELLRFAESAKAYEEFLRIAEKGNIPPSLLEEAKKSMEEVIQYVGRLIIKCDQEDADVLIDTENIGKTPLKSTIFLDIGAHNVTIIKQGFENFSKKLIIRPNITEEVSVNLQKSKDYGKITVITFPEHSNIKIDDSDKSMGFWEGLLPTGQHKIKVSKSGYQEMECSVRVKKDENLQYKIFLLPNPTPSYLTLSVNVPDVVAIIDKKIWVPLPGEFGGVSPGSHLISISESHYYPVNHQFIAGEGEKISIDIELNKKKLNQGWFWLSSALSLVSFGFAIGFHLKARDIYWDRITGDYSLEKTESLKKSGENFMYSSFGLYSAGALFAVVSIALFFKVDFKSKKSKITTKYFPLKKMIHSDDCFVLSSLNEKLGGYGQ